MSHGDHASHQKTIDLVREYNACLDDKFISIMLDTKTFSNKTLISWKMRKKYEELKKSILGDESEDEDGSDAGSDDDEDEDGSDKRNVRNSLYVLRVLYALFSVCATTAAAASQGCCCSSLARLHASMLLLLFWSTLLLLCS